MCGNGSAVILRIKTVEPSLELQIFYVQHGKKRLWNTLSAFHYPVVGKSFLVLAKCIREKFLDPWQNIYPCKKSSEKSNKIPVSSIFTYGVSYVSDLPQKYPGSATFGEVSCCLPWICPDWSSGPKPTPSLKLNPWYMTTAVDHGKMASKSHGSTKRISNFDFRFVLSSA